MGDVEISFFVEADVVAVEEGFGIDVPIECGFAFGAGCGWDAADEGDGFVVLVEDHDEAAEVAAPFEAAGVDDGEVDVLAVDDGAADPGAGEVDVAEVFSVQGEGEELVGGAGGDEEAGVFGIAVVEGDAVDAVEVVVFVAAFDFAGGGVVGEPVAAVSVGDVEVSVVGVDGGFGGAEFGFLGVFAGFLGPAEGEDFLTVEVEFDDDAALGIGKPEELLAVFVRE